MPLEQFDSSHSMTGAEATDLVPLLRAFAWSYHSDPRDADELVQKTLAEALKRTQQYRPGSNLQAWLFMTMRDLFLAEHATGQRDAADRSGPATGEAGNDLQVWSTREQELARAIHMLSRPQREVIVLIGVLGLRDTEAAEICACDIGTVKHHLCCARSNLLESLRMRKLPDAAANSPAPVRADAVPSSKQSQGV